MRISDRFLFMAVKLLVVLTGVYGVWGVVSAGGAVDWSAFAYYTVLSNLACIAYFGASFACNLRRIVLYGDTTALKPRLEAAVLFCIAITFFIYNFVILPAPFAYAARGAGLSSMCVHLFVPLLVLADWLLFAPKGTVRKSDPLLWLLIPGSYFVFVVVRAQFFGSIGTDGRYPYAFMDMDTLGVGDALINIALAALAMALLGAAILLCDGLLKKYSRNRLDR